MLVIRTIAIALAMLFLTGCPNQTKPNMNWQGTGFFSFPWPHSLRKTDQGHIDVAGFPGTQFHPIAKQIIENGAYHTPNFGNNAAVYFQFSGGLDTESLPNTEESTLNSSSIMLVNLTPESPRYLERIPLRIDFKSIATFYRPSNLLSLLPLGGFSLAPNSHYAAIVFDQLKDSDGKAIYRAPLINDLVSNTNRQGFSQTQWQTLMSQWDQVREYANSETEFNESNIAAFTYYKTQSPTDQAIAIADRLKSIPAEEIITSVNDLTLVKGCPEYAEYHGTISLPNWQAGHMPYLLTGGHIVINNLGQATLQAPIITPISIVIGCETNSSPRKVMVRADGTGGNFKSAKEIPEDFFPRNSFNQIAISVAPHHSSERRHQDIDQLAKLISSFGVEVRETHLEGLAYYNFLNPPASNGNHLQGASDHIYLRLVGNQLNAIFEGQGINITEANLPLDAFNIDTENAAIIGQSQGAGNGPLAMAMDPGFAIAYFNGASSHAYPQALHRGTVRELINSLLIGVVASELDDFHPIMQIIQTVHEPADSTNYVSYINDADLLITAGYYDGCVAREGAGALGLAFARQNTVRKGNTGTGLPEFSNIASHLNLETTEFPVTNSNLNNNKIGLFLEIAAGHGGRGAEETASAFLAKTTGSLPDIEIPAPQIPSSPWPCDTRYE